MPGILDKLGRASIPSDVAVATTVKTTRAAGILVLEAFDLSKFAVDTPVFFVTYKKTTDPVTGVVSITSLVSWKALVNAGANTLTNLTVAPGYTDLGNAVGDFIECIPTSYWENSLIDALQVGLNPDGSFKKAQLKTDLGGDSVDPIVRTLESGFDYIASGAVLAGLGYGSTLTASLSAGICYINGERQIIPAVATRAYTVSKDTYVDALYNASGTATIVYTEVANNAVSPALAANSIRIGIVVSGAANIANANSINQGQSRRILPLVSGRYLTKVDSLGNIIYPRDPSRKILGHAFKEINYSQATASGTAVAITGLFSPIIVPTGRDVKIIIDIEMSQSSSVYADLDLYDGAIPGGTLLNWKRNWYNDNSGRAHEVHMATIPDRLAAGLHTISVGFHAEGGGTASISSSGGGTELIVELV